MKICFATYPTAFQQPGGGEVVLMALRNALEEHGAEVVLFNPWSTDLRGVDVIHYFSSIGTDLFPHWQQYAPLVVTPTIWPELPPAVRIRRQLGAVARAAARRPLRGPYHAAARVLPHSQVEADLLVQNYAVRRAQLKVVPHGVDARYGRPPTGEFARMHGLERYVLCAGRIDENKNQLRLIQALSSLDVDLVLLGAPVTGQEDYGAACRASAGPRVRFVEPIPAGSDLLVDAIGGAACVVVPSIYEIWSLVAHEAGVAGVPIACTRTGPMPELLGDCASYFDPTSAVEIRAGVLAALKKVRSEEQSAHFLARVAWSSVAATVEGVYLSVAPTRPTTHSA